MVQKVANLGSIWALLGPFVSSQPLSDAPQRIPYDPSLGDVQYFCGVNYVENPQKYDDLVDCNDFVTALVKAEAHVVQCDGSTIVNLGSKLNIFPQIGKNDVYLSAYNWTEPINFNPIGFALPTKTPFWGPEGPFEPNSESFKGYVEGESVYPTFFEDVYEDAMTGCAKGQPQNVEPTPGVPGAHIDHSDFVRDGTVPFYPIGVLEVSPAVTSVELGDVYLEYIFDFVVGRPEIKVPEVVDPLDTLDTRYYCEEHNEESRIYPNSYSDLITLCGNGKLAFFESDYHIADCSEEDINDYDGLALRMYYNSLMTRIYGDAGRYIIRSDVQIVGDDVSDGQVSVFNARKATVSPTYMPRCLGPVTKDDNDDITNGNTTIIPSEVEITYVDGKMNLDYSPIVRTEASNTYHRMPELYFEPPTKTNVKDMRALLLVTFVIEPAPSRSVAYNCGDSEEFVPRDMADLVGRCAGHDVMIELPIDSLLQSCTDFDDIMHYTFAAPPGEYVLNEIIPSPDDEVSFGFADPSFNSAVDMKIMIGEWDFKSCSFNGADNESFEFSSRRGTVTVDIQNEHTERWGFSPSFSLDFTGKDLDMLVAYGEFGFMKLKFNIAASTSYVTYTCNGVNVQPTSKDNLLDLCTGSSITIREYYSSIPDFVESSACDSDQSEFIYHPPTGSLSSHFDFSEIYSTNINVSYDTGLGWYPERVFAHASSAEVDCSDSIEWSNEDHSVASYSDRVTRIGYQPTIVLEGSDQFVGNVFVDYVILPEGSTGYVHYICNSRYNFPISVPHLIDTCEGYPIEIIEGYMRNPDMISGLPDHVEFTSINGGDVMMSGFKDLWFMSSKFTANIDKSHLPEDGSRPTVSAIVQSSDTPALIDLTTEVSETETVLEVELPLNESTGSPLYSTVGFGPSFAVSNLTNASRMEVVWESDIVYSYSQSDVYCNSTVADTSNENAGTTNIDELFDDEDNEKHVTGEKSKVFDSTSTRIYCEHDTIVEKPFILTQVGIRCIDVYKARTTVEGLAEFELSQLQRSQLRVPKNPDCDVEFTAWTEVNATDCELLGTQLEVDFKTDDEGNEFGIIHLTEWMFETDTLRPTIYYTCPLITSDISTRRGVMTYSFE